MADPDRLTELCGALAERVELPPGPVVVALSGGADSAALLWLVSSAGIGVRAVHVIHGLPASSLMAAAAGQVAAAVGCRLSMVTVDPGGASESALREARHDALLAAAGGAPILLGHTADDQAETVLMRILRGTGVEGLGAMSPRRGPLLRPLLRVWRREARELATLAGLPFRDDPANSDRSLLRNRLRLELLPRLEADYGPGVREALVRLAEIARSESEMIEAAAATIPVARVGPSVWIPVGALLAAGEAASSRVLRAACRQVAPPYPPDSAAIRRALDVVHGRASAAEIGSGLRVEQDGAGILIGAVADPPAPVEPVSIAPPGCRTGSWRFEAGWVEGPAVVPMSPRAILVPEEVASGLVARAWDRDDRVTGRRVEAALTDAGIPAGQRAGWPVVAAHGDPVWIPRVRRRVWPTGHPGRYLSVVAVREPSWQPSEP